MALRRFWLDTVVAAALAVAAYLFGRELAPALGEASVRHTGLPDLIVRDPDDLRFRSLAWAFVVPPLGAWIAGAVARLRGAQVPSVLALASYLAIIATAGLVMLALQVRSFDSDLTPGPGELRPMIDVASLGIARAAILGGAAATLVLSTITWYRLGKQASRGPR